MEHLSDNFRLILGCVLAVYAVAMFIVGYFAQQRINNVEDYVVAGRRLPASLATLTIIATWFGAESLMTTTDEVARVGIRGAMLDPVGISLSPALLTDQRITKRRDTNSKLFWLDRRPVSRPRDAPRTILSSPSSSRSRRSRGYR